MFTLKERVQSENLSEVKGVPARESRIGARLISPAAGCEKKKDTSGTGPRNTKLSTYYWGHTVLDTHTLEKYALMASATQFTSEQRIENESDTPPQKGNADKPG